MRIDKDLTAIYQNEESLYVSDGTKIMLVNGGLEKTYVNGGVIPPGIEGTIIFVFTTKRRYNHG